MGDTPLDYSPTKSFTQTSMKNYLSPEKTKSEVKLENKPKRGRPRKFSASTSSSSSSGSVVQLIEPMRDVQVQSPIVIPDSDEEDIDEMEQERVTDNELFWKYPFEFSGLSDPHLHAAVDFPTQDKQWPASWCHTTLSYLANEVTPDLIEYLEEMVNSYSKHGIQPSRNIFALLYNTMCDNETLYSIESLPVGKCVAEDAVRQKTVTLAAHRLLVGLLDTAGIPPLSFLTAVLHFPAEGKKKRQENPDSEPMLFLMLASAVKEVSSLQFDYITRLLSKISYTDAFSLPGEACVRNTAAIEMARRTLAKTLSTQSESVIMQSVIIPVINYIAAAEYPDPNALEYVSHFFELFGSEVMVREIHFCFTRYSKLDLLRCCSRLPLQRISVVLIERYLTEEFITHRQSLGPNAKFNSGRYLSEKKLKIILECGTDPTALALKAELLRMLLKCVNDSFIEKVAENAKRLLEIIEKCAISGGDRDIERFRDRAAIICNAIEIFHNKINGF